MPASSQRKLLAVVVGMALLNFLLGLAQLGDGEQSSLRLYRPTNPLDAVGFFANRNHFAELLVMALPPTVVGTAWLVSERLGGRGINPLLPVAGISLMALLILGIVLGRSRAGLLLGMLALLGCLPLVTGLRKERGTRRVLTVTVAVAVMLSAQFALLGMVHRLQSDPLDDGRWRYARVTRQAAAAYAPLGSGLGTFRQAYQPFEAADTPDRAIVNHAHNDYLELWLEGGWPALLLLALGAMAWVWVSLRLWRHSPEPGTQDSLARLVARAAWLSASLAILHSALDYPLRTTANMSVFAVLVAVAFSDAPRRSRSARHVPDALPEQPMPSLPGGG
jgi:O-antigen ligase